MVTDTIYAIVLGLLTALCVAWGTVLRQAVAAETSPTGHGVGPIMSVLRLRTWWIGIFVSILGYVFQAAALRFGSLILVQTLLVLALLFSLILSARYHHRPATTPEIAWAVLLTIAVAGFIFFGELTQGHVSRPPWVWGVVSCLGVLLLGLSMGFAGQFPARTAAMILGAAAGVAFAFIAVFTKAVVEKIGTLPALDILLLPQTIALGVAAIAGIVVQQASFHAGELKQSLPMMVIVEPFAALILGIILFGESFNVSGTDTVILVLCGALMTASAFFLARSEASH